MMIKRKPSLWRGLFLYVCYKDKKQLTGYSGEAVIIQRFLKDTFSSVLTLTILEIFNLFISNLR